MTGVAVPNVPDAASAWLAAGNDVLGRVCERVWARASEPTRRLSAAGFNATSFPRIGDLGRVAILPKGGIAALQAANPPLGGLSTRPLSPGSLFCSPGGLFEPDMPNSTRRLARILASRGFGPGDVVLNCFNYHLTPGGSLFHEALVQAGCTVIAGGPHNSEALIDILLRARVTGFVGIASHLQLLVDKFKAAHPPGSTLHLRKAMAGGEPAAAQIRASLKRDHGIDAFDAYGAAEVGIIAGACSVAAELHIDHEVLVEIVDPDTGRPADANALGEVVVTADDENYPMLRLGTGDLARIDFTRCACGSVAPRLFLSGRIAGSVRVRGMLLHEIQVRNAFASLNGVRAVQLRLSRVGAKDFLQAFLQIDANVDKAACTAAFAESFAAVCRLRLDEVNFVESLPPQATVLDDRRFEVTAP